MTKQEAIEPRWSEWDKEAKRMEQIAEQEAREIQEQNRRWLEEYKETSLQDGELS